MYKAGEKLAEPKKYDLRRVGGGNCSVRAEGSGE